jgi:hypothetical protein
MERTEVVNVAKVRQTATTALIENGSFLDYVASGGYAGKGRQPPVHPGGNHG